MKTNQSLRTTYWISPTLSQNLKTWIIYQMKEYDWSTKKFKKHRIPKEFHLLQIRIKLLSAVSSDSRKIIDWFLTDILKKAFIGWWNLYLYNYWNYFPPFSANSRSVSSIATTNCVMMMIWRIRDSYLTLINGTSGIPLTFSMKSDYK